MNEKSCYREKFGIYQFYNVQANSTVVVGLTLVIIDSSQKKTLIDDHLYSAVLHSLEQTHCARLWLCMSDKLYSTFLNIHQSGVLTALAWLVPHETAAVSAQVLCSPYNHAPCHFMQSHIRKGYACLAVTCHLHFWQNDRDLLRATVVTRGWNGYRNKSQHRQSTWRRKFSRRSCRDSNPRPFNHESGALTTELSPPMRKNEKEVDLFFSKKAR